MDLKYIEVRLEILCDKNIYYAKLNRAIVFLFLGISNVLFKRRN